ncbi:MAG: murein L,D-transpeptidase catalytic domain family protein [Tatlockia sp.]|nr:murein L,D-transpeptidase catalytic domain family protein [Tatlockia sp.]
MRKNLLLILAVTSTCFSLPSPQLQQEKLLSSKDTRLEKLLNLLNLQISYANPTAAMPIMTLAEIQTMLNEDNTLSPGVIDKVLKSIKCVNEYNIQHNHILTIIDYSLPSNQKRLWVFDLKERKPLFNTYVSHGVNSGTLLTKFFSNKYNSKSSSLGVFKTDKTYYGRHGLSLQLEGLESGFNDNASNRAVVMHGGWYVDEDFIKKYGRAGRSWGCPALPENITTAIINTIKDDALFVVYYPSDNWFVKSKFLNCDKQASAPYLAKMQELKPMGEDIEKREDVLFAKISAKNKEEPIVTVSATDYTRLFNTIAPLGRMLRRQINSMEYIALSNTEFESLVSRKNENDLNSINFVIPVIKNVRGYYETQMHILDLGKIKDIHMNMAASNKSFTVDFEFKPSIQLRATNQFIRWLGL